MSRPRNYETCIKASRRKNRISIKFEYEMTSSEHLVRYERVNEEDITLEKTLRPSGRFLMDIILTILVKKPLSFGEHQQRDRVSRKSTAPLKFTCEIISAKSFLIPRRSLTRANAHAVAPGSSIILSVERLQRAYLR